MGVFIHRSAVPLLFLAALLLPAVVSPADDSLLVSPAGAVPRLSPADVKARLASIGMPSDVEADARSRERWKAVHRFYQLRGYRLAWVSAGRLTRQADSLLR